MTEPNQYPAWTLADMANIPDEALPRFLAELPAMIETVRQLQSASAAISKVTARPWWLRWTNDSTWASIIQRGFANASSSVWIDDNKGVATVKISDGKKVIFQQSERVGK